MAMKDLDRKRDSDMMPPMTKKITLLTADRVEAWLEANERTRGKSHVYRLIRFWQDMLDGDRLIWAGWDYAQADADGQPLFLGHISLQKESQYPPFRKYRVPEIVDVWVQPEARRTGLGQRLLQKAIDAARQDGAPAIGMGVGLTKSYGAAHLLYGKNGFAPDGTGLWVEGVQPGEDARIRLGPDAILMWVKPLA